MTLVKSHGLANRPGEPYPATFHSFQWTHWESNRAPIGHGWPDWSFPACRAGAVPFGHEPIKWSVGESNPDCLGASQASSRWTNAPLVFFKRSVRELNPVLLLTMEVCCRNTYRPLLNFKVIPDGVEPSLSWVSSRRLSRWTTGSIE